MPQLNKTSSSKNSAGKAPTSEKHIKLRAEAVDRARKRRRTTFIIIASVVIVIVLVIVGVFYYFSEDARYSRLTIITVDDTSIKMDYFLKRTWLAGVDARDMLAVLTNEQLVKVAAPQYVAEASPEEVDQELRRIASGESEPISENEFKEWYRQLLNEMDLSDSEYKEYVATSILANRLQEYLAERVPTVAEQIYLLHALLNTEEVAEILEKEDAGENTEELISEIWQDKQSEGVVEDLGWLPRGVLPYGLDDIVFSLTIGDISESIPYVDYTSPDYDIYYYLFMVSEKADAREIDEDPLQVLKAQALDHWLEEETKFHEIEWNFNSEIYAWMNHQLAKE